MLNQQGLINGFLDDTLTEEGMTQAREAAELMPQTIKHIYSSSLGRAKETAEIINEKLGVGLTFHDELKEVNFGDLQGTPYLDEYRERHIHLDYDWRPTGECVEDVKKRVLSVLKEISMKSGDEEALIVAHGGIIRMLYFLELNELVENIPNASIHSFDLDKILV